MTDTLNPNYLLENIFINRILLVDIVANAPVLNLSLIGKSIKKEFKNAQLINETFEIDPTIERFLPIKLECELNNIIGVEQHYNFKVSLYQGATTCGQILKTGILKPFQMVKFIRYIYFPFV